MVDLHTHILPNIDDGAGSVSEALKMEEVMYTDKIDLVVCTPHFDPAQTSLEDFVQRRSEAMALMDASKITFFTGSETILHDYLFYYQDIRPLFIGKTGYLLLELPYSKKWGREVYEAIETLMHTYDLIPVIAHIERYEAVIKMKKNIEKLMEIGCLLQVNASSIIEEKTRRRVIDYLKNGYIDVIASDCHNMNYRPPNIVKAYEIITQEIGIGCYDSLKQNAEKIVAGEQIKKKSEFMIDD